MKKPLEELISLLRSSETIKHIINQIKKDLDEIGVISEPLSFMHVCGTHEDTLMKHGLRYMFSTMLNDRIRMVAGPGCPVCVSPVQDVDFAIAVSDLSKVIITSYGDMVRVPGSSRSLEEQRRKGSDVITVYSVTDAVKIAKNNSDKNIVFISPGFETTTPATAIEVLNRPPENFFVLSSHRLVPPALDVLMTLPELQLNGFILPGHVSVIIGEKAYTSFVDKWNKPVAIAGFEPLDLLQGISSVVQQIKDEKPDVKNAYGRAVTFEGNLRAQKAIHEVFHVVDAGWRGLGVFKDSGLEIRPEFAHLDARKEFIDQIELEPVQEIPPGCSCHRVVIGAIGPEECPLFQIECTPESPVGPCMVGLEGTCRIRAIYGD
ncbi:MAG: hydrogenase formation protein HypD [Candidatus Hodarchaeales archaeon]|jgi:hydrogenase expression/formation protein HypD